MDTKTFKLEHNQYLSDVYLDEINANIDKYKSLLIKGGTGIGKTEATKKLALMNVGKYNKVIIACPYNAVVANYIGPNIPKYDPAEGWYRDTAFCMTYDRLAYMSDMELKDSLIFIDECHTLFRERSFRDALIALYTRINTVGKWVFVSATPEIETNNCELCMEFYKERPMIPYKLVTTSHPLKAIINYVQEQLDNNITKRLFIFSDQYAATVKDWFSTDDRVGIFHTKYKTGQSSSSYILDKPAYVSTRVAFNGLNFNNEDEDVIIISMLEGEVTAGTIIQQVGRFRKSNVKLILLKKDVDAKSTSIKERTEMAEDCGVCGISSLLVSHNERLRDPQYVKILQELESFFDIETASDVINIRLKDTGYFINRTKDVEFLQFNKGKLINQENREADKEIRTNWKDIRDRQQNGVMDFPDSPIGQKMAAKMAKVNEMVDDLLIDEQHMDMSFDELHMMIDTMHSTYRKLNYIITNDVVTLSVELDQLQNRIMNRTGKLKAEMQRSLNKQKALIDKYAFVPNMNAVVEMFVDEKKEQYEQERLNKIEGGKNSSPKKSVEVMWDGEWKQFDSKGDADRWLRSQGTTQSQLRLYKMNPEKYKVL